jgi:hypothetical protein
MTRGAIAARRVRQRRLNGRAHIGQGDSCRTERGVFEDTFRPTGFWGVYYAPFIDIGALLSSLREQLRK